jgi:hypothetical protein
MTDSVIALDREWQRRSEGRRLQYFIPEWDDLVDPNYDFATDTHSAGRGDWSTESYAHELYPSPNYDGLLVSKVMAEKSKKKTARLEAMGVHRFLRVPKAFPIMGDCGAFGYLTADVPPYSTPEIVEYYTRLGFDYGVSIDHLIVKATMDQRDHRYQLTLTNAEAFLAEHRRTSSTWTPMAAVQGWDVDTYRSAAIAVADMGYTHLALGGLVRTRTPAIIELVRAVSAAIPNKMNLHLFGVARASALAELASLGVTSFDSASYLRRAWLGARDNYHTLETDYCALRIPDPNRSFRAKRAVRSGKVTQEAVERLERRCLALVRGYDRGSERIDDVLEAIEQYDRLIGDGRRHAKHDLRRTLEDQPWKRCPCTVCQEVGVEVIIFRGNNRNRRRGFHNTWVFFQLLQREVG